MLGYHCDSCGVDWPDDRQYKTCPKCHVGTAHFDHLKPLTAKEAHSLVLHLQFENFYTDYCKKKGQPVYD